MKNGPGVESQPVEKRPLSVIQVVEELWESASRLWKRCGDAVKRAMATGAADRLSA